MNRLMAAVFLALLVCLGVQGVPLPQQSSGSGGQSSTAAAPPTTVTAPATVVSEKSGKSASETPSLDDALELYRAGKWDDAEREYNALIAAQPSNPGAYAGLARVYLKEKKIPEAYAAASKAVAVSPNFADAHVALGEVYFRQGKLHEAEQEFITQARANTDDARAYLGMARMSKANSYYKQANRMIDAAYKLDPHDPDIWRERLAFLTSAEVQKARSDAAQSQQEQTKSIELANESSETPKPVQITVKRAARTCQLVSKLTSMESKLKTLFNDPTHIAGYGLDVGLNGTRATLRVDTGAGGILVTRGVAEKAGLKHVVDANIGGIGDKAAAAGYIAFADSIRIGDLEFEHCPVEVIEKSPMKEADGLIGGDVFEDFLVDLDFPVQKLRLSQLPPIPGADTSQPAALQPQGSGPRYYDRYVAPEMKSYTPVSRFGHMLLVPTSVNQLPPKLFLVDTGAFGNMISPTAAREVTGVSTDSYTYVKGLSGNVKTVFRANELTITFGHLRQKNEDMVAFDLSPMSDSAGTEISGILGFSMLAMLEMKIDYRDGLVDFIYDENKARRFH